MLHEFHLSLSHCPAVFDRIEIGKRLANETKSIGLAR